MADQTKVETVATEQHSLINSTFPVLLPHLPEMHLNKEDFDTHIKSLFPPATKTLPIRVKDATNATDAASKPTTKTETATSDASKPAAKDSEDEAFMAGLLADDAAVPSLDSRDGKMLTENADVAYKNSGEALVNLFYELEEVISAHRLKQVLEKAWTNDSDATLKIIWNARSIHLGKSSRNTFYRAVGWLAQKHPLTLVENMVWLVRPLIAKKAPPKEVKKEGAGEGDGELVTKEEVDSDFEIVEGEEAEDEKAKLEGEPAAKKLKLDEDAQLAEFDVKYGVSHGYWKDLLNILALAANSELKVDGDPKSVLNVAKPAEKKYKRDWTEGRKKAITTERHDRVVEELKNDKLYQALHVTVARLFADQLKMDLARLRSGSKADMKRITLASKWAPTHKGFHDQHTCIVTSIAELLHSFESACPEGVDPGDRQLYLKYARIAYQSQTLSPLRKHLNVVERDITAEKFADIKYERVPSLAMKQYTPLFAKKDYEHFDKYIDHVASGKKQISGATLLPSTLVHAVHGGIGYSNTTAKKRGADAMVEKKLHDIQVRTIDAQWNTLVKRIKDSGTLQSSIAVCDVSGSMQNPVLADGTCAMSSSIGLSLLIAEVTEPPFGGAFITFDNEPQVVRVGGADDKRTFEEKVQHIARADWGGSTDFVATFEKLILPIAIENKLTQEQMVKQLFVFSDMQFNSAAGRGRDSWTTSYERIQKKYKEAGYEMPQLIFWNLAGGRAGYEQTSLGSGVEGAAPKPVTAAEENTALVSGYSQGMMKMFLDGSGFGEPEEEEEEVVEEEVVEEEGEDGEVVVGKKAKEKKKKDPLAVVRKAIGHEAYRMLKVWD
ncbi:hypothetical protein LTR09_005965 [Extremus antarcticus]|uniref:Uncharacterized protein n=1 Tax=Extremus antarcticus TaxID=702011 RepID=A0AAJ0GDK7_9PEZI|nr:hypothetical protein LTR09_005965 [Extremus antarcticus]